MAEIKAQSREERLKAALRANLKRRKAQARGRSDGDRKGNGEATGTQGPSSPRTE
jgi:hypothetical protein